MAMSKEKQQIVALVVVLAIIAGVILYFSRDKFLPKPSGGEALPPASRLNVPTSVDYQKLFDRADYKALKAYGNVPVQPLANGHNDKPFEPPPKVATK